MSLLVDEGIAGLTHRKVEDRAGAAHGSTTYHFGTREKLIDALLEMNASRQHELMNQIALEASKDPTLDRTDLRALLHFGMSRMMQLFLAEKDHALARFELYLYASRRPHLQNMVRYHRNMVIAEQAATLRAMDVQHPEAASRMMLSLFEGIMIMVISVPSEAHEAWAPAMMIAATNAAMNLPHVPSAPEDEAATFMPPVPAHAQLFVDSWNADAGQPLQDGDGSPR